MRQGERRRLPLVATMLASAAMALAPSSALAGISSGPPDIAVDDAWSGTEDQDLNVGPPGVMANDPTSSEGSCVAATDVASLVGHVDLGSSGLFTYTPPANYHGQTSFTYGLMLARAEGCPGPYDDTATVTLTIDPVNDAPTAVADTFQTLIGTTLNVNAPGVLGNDSDIDGDELVAVKVNDPAHGVVVLAADGSFSYTPAAGYVGPDVFSYRASDGVATSPVRTVSMTVSAIPTPKPSPTPDATPTAFPTTTPSASAEPSPSPSAGESSSALPSDGPSVAPSVAPSAVAPSPSADPSTAAGGGGPSLPVLLVLVLFFVLLAFGAAWYVPRWIQAQRSGGRVDAFDDDQPV